MRIALVGTRGVPAAYSGFETAVENIGSRLAARGHDVTVYCRPHMVERRRGRRLPRHAARLPPHRGRQAPRHAGAHPAQHAAPGHRAPPGRGHLLHRRQQPVRGARPAPRRPDRHQRGRPGLAARQVGSVGAPLPAPAPSARRPRSPTSPSPTRATVQALYRALGPRDASSSPTAPSWTTTRRGRPRRRARTISASSRAATCSSSGGSCPRTTRTCWSRRSAGSRPTCAW